jgi:hypothetical protein
MRHENAFSLFNLGNGQESHKTMSSDKVNRPFSALISILEVLCELSRNSFGIVAIFPSPSQPVLCPESPVSPRISTRQEMVSGK